MKTVDCKGMKCPEPLMAVRREIKNGKSFCVIIDNETSFENVTRFLEDNSLKHNCNLNNGIHYINIILDQEIEFVNEQLTNDTVTRTGDYIVVISSDKMGDGDPELGKILIKGYISTLSEADRVPDEIIFYNSGVLLTRKDSSVAELLLKLSEMNVKITICGTCADFYGIKQEIVTGQISNMFYISDKLSKAALVIKP